MAGAESLSERSFEVGVATDEPTRMMKQAEGRRIRPQPVIAHHARVWIREVVVPLRLLRALLHVFPAFAEHRIEQG